MVFIYEKQTGRIIQFNSGYISQINAVLKYFPEKDGIVDEIIFEDDINVINNPHNYRLLIYKNKVIDYYLKPKLTLSLENGKNTIIGDGIDSTNLVIELAELHPLEKSLLKHDGYYLSINSNIQKVTSNIIPITSNDIGMNIYISGDITRYRTNSVILEVVPND